MAEIGRATHKDWLGFEYQLWCDALNKSSPRNFRDHPMVQRMLTEPKPHLFRPLMPALSREVWAQLKVIDSIGFGTSPAEYSGLMLRHVFYASQVAALKPSGIVEIGGGVGHFLAVLLALGWRGSYRSFDLPDVEEFKRRFLREVASATGLQTERPAIDGPPYPFLCSFYALGEFDDELKDRYIRDVVQNSDHGLVVWNPHSGATRDVGFACEIEWETPLTGLGNKVLRW